jgi:hypothetical protein
VSTLINLGGVLGEDACRHTLFFIGPLMDGEVVDIWHQLRGDRILV